MNARSFGRCRIHRIRLGWVLAWLAMLLNATAPVIAYASAAARTSPTQAAVAVHHHGASHHAGHVGATPSTDAPVAPHCQYCLDFAAGAPLSLAIGQVFTHPPVASDIPFGPPARAASKPLLRLAYPRGPPYFVA